MWFRITISILVSFSVLTQAAGQNFPGDTLAAGQQYASTSMSLSDWHASGDFVGDASTATDIDDSQRGFLNASNKGYDFKTYLTYMVGLTSDISIGLNYGYIFQKDESSIASNDFNSLEGDWIQEGGTDLTLLGKYRLGESTSLDISMQLPICSVEGMNDVCSSRPPIPENLQQSGRNGGQGDGFYRLGSAISSNWLTEQDTHWMGSLYALATLSDDVYGRKVSSPFTYGAQFGAVMPLQQNHSWTGMLSITRMLEHSAYSDQLQTKVNYGQHSNLAFTAEYLWDFMKGLQLRPFTRIAMEQRPTQSFENKWCGSFIRIYIGDQGDSWDGIKSHVLTLTKPLFVI